MDKIKDLAAAAVAALGGFLVALGWVDSETVSVFVTNIETIVGAGLAIVGAVGGILTTIKARKAAAKAGE